MTPKEFCDYVNAGVKPGLVGPMVLQAQGDWGFTWSDDSISGAVLFQPDGSVKAAVDVVLNEEGELDENFESALPIEWLYSPSLEALARNLVAGLNSED